jgi:hypothetical protein
MRTVVVLETEGKRFGEVHVITAHRQGNEDDIRTQHTGPSLETLTVSDVTVPLDLVEDVRDDSSGARPEHSLRRVDEP